MQDVFIKLWDVRERLEIKQHFRGYLFRMCHNRAIDVNKEIASRQHLLDQLLYYYRSMPELESYTEQQLQRYDALVEAALATLSPQRRRVYELCRKEKKSYEEAARLLNISVNTVKVHVKQTLLLLRQYIKENMNLSVIILVLQKFL